MSDAEQRLTAALKNLRPVARDPAFRIAVLERQARRQLQTRIAAVAVAGPALTGMGLAAEPYLDALGSVAGVGAVPAAMLAGSLTIVGWCLVRMRRPI